MTMKERINQSQWYHDKLAEKDADIEHLRKQCESIRKLYEGLPDRYDELDGKYADALDEIKRLKDELLESRRDYERVMELLRKNAVTSGKREALLTRAADALGEIRPSRHNGKDVSEVSVWWKETDTLITKLRESAK
jgi:chromosome segregation ATPase